ncbi:MAG: hypothetical protein WC717_01295 [Candidatus Micrarchaeia archaeon]|jgi:hypothetical protein
MFLFQEAALSGNGRGSPPLLISKLNSVFTTPGATIGVIDIQGKSQPWTFGKLADHVHAELEQLKGANIYSALKEKFGEKDEQIIAGIRVAAPWFDMKALEELKDGGSREFNLILGQLASSSDFSEAMSKASVISSNSHSDGKYLNDVGLQVALVDIKVSALLSAYMLSSADQASKARGMSMTAFGSVSSLNFELGGSDLSAHMCMNFAASVFSGMCMPFSLTSDAYADESPGAQPLIGKGSGSAETQATVLFGKGFVGSVKGMIAESVRRFLDAKPAGAGAGDPLASFIIDRLQMQWSIDAMKGTSEFVSGISEKERRKRQEQDGNLGGFA